MANETGEVRVRLRGIVPGELRTGGRVRLLCGLLAAAAVGARSEERVPADRLYELARPLWGRESKGFLREWLICGDFPNPPHAGQTTYDHTPPCVGLETDYLKEHGGEESIRPQEGMAHTRPDGKSVAWRAVRAEKDELDLLEVFKEYWLDNVVAYAFTTIRQPNAAKVWLGIGSDDGIRVWVNGRLVHEYLGSRAVGTDDDVVPVELKAGENTILLKVESGSGPWGFCCRVLADPAFAACDRPFLPKVESELGHEPLVVRPQSAPGALPGALGSVTVEVLRPGGQVIARAAPHADKLLQFPTDALSDGPYEVRFTQHLGFGRRHVVYLPWFKGDGAAAVARVEAAAAAADPATADGMLYKLLGEKVAKEVGGGLSGTGTTTSALTQAWDTITGEATANDTGLDAYTLKDLHSALTEFEELQLAAAGKADLERPGGFVRLAYRDEVDGSPQFCRAYLPAEYDPARKWPLVVDLHRSDTIDPPYLEWEDVFQRHNAWADENGVIVLVPHGRFKSWYKGIGMKDVLRCIRMAKERFAVDEDRVYLTGRSMGGGGVWEIGTRSPQLFAAIAPVYGGWDDRILKDAYQLEKLTPRQRFFAECYSSFARAESLLTTPVFLNHGINDTYVNVSHSRLAVRMLQRWGYDVRYWEHVGKGHEVFSDDQLGHEQALIEWLLTHTRVNNPRQVRIRADDLKSASVHWVRVEQREDPLAFLYVDAEVVAPNFIRVNTENVLALTLSPGAELVDPALPLKVDWNGRGLADLRLTEGKVTLEAPGYTPAALTKRPELEGPIRDVFSTPFAIVVGTVSDDQTRRANCERRAADLVSQWEKEQHCKPRQFKDTELTDTDLRRYSLVLIGGPSDNLVTRKLIDKLPLRLEGNRIELAGKAFDAPDSLIRLVYPHPLNKDRYLLVEAATSSAAILYTAQTKDPLGFYTAEGLDFYLTDGKQPEEDADRPEEKAFLASGYFDHNWQYADRFTVLGDADVRAKCRKQGESTYTDPAKTWDPYNQGYKSRYGEDGYEGMEGRSGAPGDGTAP